MTVLAIVFLVLVTVTLTVWVAGARRAYARQYRADGYKGLDFIPHPNSILTPSVKAARKHFLAGLRQRGVEDGADGKGQSFTSLLVSGFNDGEAKQAYFEGFRKGAADRRAQSLLNRSYAGFARS